MATQFIYGDSPGQLAQLDLAAAGQRASEREAANARIMQLGALVNQMRQQKAAQSFAERQLQQQADLARQGRANQMAIALMQQEEGAANRRALQDDRLALARERMAADAVEAEKDRKMREAAKLFEMQKEAADNLQRQAEQGLLSSGDLEDALGQFQDPFKSQLSTAALALGRREAEDWDLASSVASRYNAKLEPLIQKLSASEKKTKAAKSGWDWVPGYDSTTSRQNEYQAALKEYSSAIDEIMSDLAEQRISGAVVIDQATGKLRPNVPRPGERRLNRGPGLPRTQQAQPSVQESLEIQSVPAQEMQGPPMQLAGPTVLPSPEPWQILPQMPAQATAGRRRGLMDADILMGRSSRMPDGSLILTLPDGSAEPLAEPVGGSADVGAIRIGGVNVPITDEDWVVGTDAYRQMRALGWPDREARALAVNRMLYQSRLNPLQNQR